MQTFDFRHHSLVDRQASGGVDNQNVVMMFARVVVCGQRNVQRFLADVGGKEVDLELFREGAQLLDRGWSLHVAADKQHFFPVLFVQQLGELAAGGGFTCTLQARHQNNRGRHGGEV